MTQHAPLVPSFFSIDLILTPKGEVKILELNRGVDSGFYGYQALHKVDLFEQALALMPFRQDLYADRPDNMVGRLAGLLPDIELVDDVPVYPHIYPGAMDMHDHLRRQYPDAVLVDGSLPLYAAFKNKAMFHALFSPHCPDMLPDTVIVANGHDWEWNDLARHCFSRASLLVLKTPEDIQGDGVFIVPAHEGTDIFDDARLPQGAALEEMDGGDLRRMFEYPSFVVQELVKSRPVVFQGQEYASCIRVAALAIPYGDQLDVQYLGAYAKPAAAPLREMKDVTYNDRYVSKVTGDNGSYDNARSVAVEPGIFNHIKARLAQGFEPALAKVMALRPQDMMRQLLETQDEGTRMTALSAVFSRDMFSAHGMERADIRATQNMLADFIDNSTAAQRFILARTARMGRADMVPEIFRGVVDRAIRRHFTFSRRYNSNNTLQQSADKLDSLGEVFRYASRLSDRSSALGKNRSEAFFHYTPHEGDTVPFEIIAFEPRPFMKEGDLACLVEGCFPEKPQPASKGWDKVNVAHVEQIIRMVMKI